MKIKYCFKTEEERFKEDLKRGYALYGVDKTNLICWYRDPNNVNKIYYPVVNKYEIWENIFSHDRKLIKIDKII